MPSVTRPSPRSAQSAATDESLLLRYRDFRDPEAFATLVHRYEKPLYHYLVQYLRNSSLAEEVLQAAFLRVHQKCHLFAKGSSVRPWLYSISTHLAIDALRREGRHHAVRLDEDHASGDVEDGRFMSMLESTTISPLDRMETEERAEWTREAIDNLPDHLRMVVLLIYFHGRKYQEAAEVLHVPLGTIKSRLHKALVVLNQAWRRNQG